MTYNRTANSTVLGCPNESLRLSTTHTTESIKNVEVRITEKTEKKNKKQNLQRRESLQAGYPV